MRRRFWISLSICFVLVLCFAVIMYFRWNQNRNHYKKELYIVYPFNGALFPPEFTSPVFRWEDNNPQASSWKINLYFKGNEKGITDICESPNWQPRLTLWDSIKTEAGNKKIYFKVIRNADGRSDIKIKIARISFSISPDSVGAPILYREIPLPFAWAELHLDSMSYRLVDPGSDDPPLTVMKKFMVCGNCHSFSADGKTIGLDFDAAHRDKGGYFISAIKDTMVFDTSNYLSWNKLQEQKSFGMFSKISPDGRYVVTTIKDRVISHNFKFDPDKIAFSQIFFPVNGVLAIYDRVTGKLGELPGANLEEYVQSNAFWTPDGKNILFVRAKALPYAEGDSDYIFRDEKAIDDFVNRRTDFKFDIYTIPFNEGKGGEAKPIKGASDNGMSNYFPAVSPDGKWLVFCKAENYMLLMPDSRLYIVPLEGGKARKLGCNMYLMNSWHAWSPNSKWMVFVSKGLNIYSDMFLTRIDDRGNASIPVLIETARKKGRVANYPEFMYNEPDIRYSMVYRYVDIAHIRRAMAANDTTLSGILYRQYLNQEQYALADEYIFLARYNIEKKKYLVALEFIEMALKKEPKNAEASTLYYFLRSRMK